MMWSTHSWTDSALVSSVTSGLSGGSYGIVDAGEAHRLAVGDGRACLGVHALDVALLADVDRRAAIDLDEVSLGHLAGLVADRPVRADDRAERGAAVLGDQAGDVADAPDVRVAVFLAEAQALGEVRADLVAVQGASSCGRTRPAARSWRGRWCSCPSPRAP